MQKLVNQCRDHTGIAHIGSVNSKFLEGGNCLLLLQKKKKKDFFWKSFSLTHFILVGRARLELATNGLKVRCSTN